METSTGEVTRLLQDLSEGNRESLGHLYQRFASGPLDWAALRAAAASRPRPN